jgi:uncharacterized protein with PQ loop repeat
MTMTISALSSTLAVVAPTLTVLQLGAQAVRIRRTGAQGVSLGTWLLSCFVAEIWLCYGFVFHVPAEIGANIPCLIVAAVVTYLAATSQGQLTRSGAGLLGLTVVTGLATFIGTFRDARWIMATVAVGSSVIIYLPQLVKVLRPKDLSGVSALSWFMGCVTSLCWFVYGLSIHQPAISLPSVVMLPSAIIILVQVMRHRVTNDPLHGLQAPIIE